MTICDLAGRQKISKTKKFGFTLVELLVVIAIIGLLSAMSIVSLRNSALKGRDMKRVADLRQMALALEMYYQQNSFYPSTSSYGESDVVACHGGGWDCSNLDNDSDGVPFMTFLKTSGLMGTIPKDPVNDANHHFVYYYYGDKAVHNGCNGPFYFLIAYGMESTPPASKVLDCYTPTAFTSANSYIIMGGPNL